MSRAQASTADTAEAEYTIGSEDSLDATLRQALGSVAAELAVRDENLSDSLFPPFEAAWLRELRSRSPSGSSPLTFPLRIDIAQDPDDGEFLVIAPFLKSAGSGQTVDEALEDLASSVLSLRDELRLTQDSSLAADALEAKRRISLLVG